MGCDDKNVAPRAFSVRMVRGEPYEVSGRILTPVTRIVSLGKASGTVGTDRISGWGGGLVWITPVAVLEESDGGQRKVAIYDATSAILQRLCVVTLAFTFFFTTIRWWVHRQRQAHCD